MLLQRLVMALLVTACSAGARGAPVKLPDADRLNLAAELVMPAAGNNRWARYIIKRLPAGHGYERGRLVALLSRAGKNSVRRPVGLAEVVSAGERSLELVASWVDPSYAFETLELGQVPSGHHFGKQLGAVIELTRDRRRVTVDIGSAHGARVGDLYKVLGAGYTDVDVGGRSLGRRDIGTLQLVEVHPRGQTAVGELVDGEAPERAIVRFAGHASIHRRPALKLVIMRFQGDRGDVYRHALLSALHALRSAGLLQEVTIEAKDEAIDISDAGGSQARRLGTDFGADVVLWGSASSVGDAIAVRPRATFVDPGWSGELERLWSVVSIDQERILRDGADQVSQQVRGLAAYMAGWMYFSEFEHAVTGAYARAAAHFHEAIEYGDAIDVRNARVWLFYCLERTGDWAAAERVAREVEQEGIDAGTEHRRALGLYMRAVLADDMGTLDAAVAYARAAVQRFEKGGHIGEVAVVRGRLAEILYKMGDRSEALRIYREEVLPTFERLKDSRSRILTLGRVAEMQAEFGQLAVAFQTLEKVIADLQNLGDLRSMAAFKSKLADLTIRRGEQAEALRIQTEEVLPVYEKLGDLRACAVTRGKIADIWSEQGRLDEVLRVREEQLRVFRALGDIREEAVTLGKLADVRFRQGDMADAMRIRRDEQLPMFEQLGDVRERAATIGKIAEIHFFQHAHAKALAGFEQALAVHRRLGERRETLVCQINIAVVLLTRLQPGDREQARRYLREARASEDVLGLAAAAQVRRLVAIHQLSMK